MNTICTVEVYRNLELMTVLLTLRDDGRLGRPKSWSGDKYDLKREHVLISVLDTVSAFDSAMYQ